MFGNWRHPFAWKGGSVFPSVRLTATPEAGRRQNAAPSPGQRDALLRPPKNSRPFIHKKTSHLELYDPVSPALPGFSAQQHLAFSEGASGGIVTTLDGDQEASRFEPSDQLTWTVVTDIPHWCVSAGRSCERAVRSLAWSLPAPGRYTRIGAGSSSPLKITGD